VRVGGCWWDMADGLLEKRPRTGRHDRESFMSEGPAMQKSSGRALRGATLGQFGLAEQEAGKGHCQEPSCQCGQCKGSHFHSWCSRIQRPSNSRSASQSCNCGIALILLAVAWML